VSGAGVCDRRGTERDTDAERDADWMGRRSWRPEGDDFQRSAGDVPARKWCLWHRRDSHRLAPLEFGVNGQDVESGFNGQRSPAVTQDRT